MPVSDCLVHPSGSVVGISSVDESKTDSALPVAASTTGRRPRGAARVTTAVREAAFMMQLLAFSRVISVPTADTAKVTVEDVSLATAWYSMKHGSSLPTAGEDPENAMTRDCVESRGVGWSLRAPRTTTGAGGASAVEIVRERWPTTKIVMRRTGTTPAIAHPACVRLVLVRRSESARRTTPSSWTTSAASSRSSTIKVAIATKRTKSDVYRLARAPSVELTSTSTWERPRDPSSWWLRVPIP